jgi:activator of HSP90 ATPase
MTKTTDIHEMVTFKASAQQLYDILLDSKRLSEASGGAAVKMEKRIGGKFRVKGWWSGVNLDLVRGKRIVQAWRWDQQAFGAWPEGHFSVVSCRLDPGRKSTRLTFDHLGVPASAAGVIADGWRRFHWEPIQAMLSDQRNRDLASDSV